MKNKNILKISAIFAIVFLLTVATVKAGTLLTNWIVTSNTTVYKIHDDASGVNCYIAITQKGLSEESSISCK